jgi:hypothetical protein
MCSLLVVLGLIIMVNMASSTPSAYVDVASVADYTDRIGNYAPPPGKVFLICDLDMKLVGVSKLSFIAEDLNFCARVNNSDYPMDTIAQSLLKTNKAGYSQSIDLKDDGEISRTVVFSIPECTRNYKLICKGPWNWPLKIRYG